MNNREDSKARLDLAAIRTRLASAEGPQFWRSLEEVADTEEFQLFLHDEFPQLASAPNEGVNRRDFMKLMAASLALAGLNACTRQPVEKILPYVNPPEQLIPGKPLYFATAHLRNGYANGVLVESHTGRPTKVEGNPDHPASLGATDIFAQASVLGLYDPDRSRVVLSLGEIGTWEAFAAAIATELELKRSSQGAGFRILTETITSPTLTSQIQALLAKYPNARWHQYEPGNRDNARNGSRLAFGEFVETQYRFDQAQVIFSLDCNFLYDLPGSLRYAREFMNQRRVAAGREQMNRLYVAESSPSITGAMADHCLTMRAGEVASFAQAVAAKLGVISTAPESELTPKQSKWINALAKDLQQHRGTSLIVAGDEQPPIVHALAHAMNFSLGNVGSTVIYTEPVEANPMNQTESLQELVTAMEAGEVDTLLMLGGNPAYNAPADFDFAKKLATVRLRIHLSQYEDETSALCHWHIPETHSFEAWSDARAFDATVTIMQPLIAPLYGGKSAHEVLALFNGEGARSSYEIVRDFWKRQRGEQGFEEFWQIALHQGLVAQSSAPEKSVQLQAQNLSAPDTESPQPADGILELIFRNDPSILDGRYANNAWLQELPKPISKLTWDNAVLIAPATAERLGLKNEDEVELSYRGRSVKAPVWIVPGHPQEAVTVSLGYGRTRAGRVGNRTGFNAYALRTSDAPWFGSGLEIRKTGEHYPLSTTQAHQTMENRALVRAGTLEEYRAHPDFVHEMEHSFPEELTLYPEHEYEGYKWGMAIDLNSCIGCHACTIACQAENNIPIVGKDQVAAAREMHWIRVDRYYEGELDDPDIYFQPVPCMHCENAPCEPVCPVSATVHSDEGLNEMVYNRCVGTRYCSNNCPYKVRRFNFFHYSQIENVSLRMVQNPDVTVRARGVMEKCTYCVQRINVSRIEAKNQNRQIHDGEVVSACQQVCPTQAIVFGDLNDPNSAVSKLKATPLNYGLLSFLNTRPRTTYLARLHNPNPELEEVA